MLGHVEQAFSFLESHKPIPTHKFWQSFGPLFSSSCALLSALARVQGYQFSLPIIEESISEPPHWYRSTLSLLEQNPKEALYWARQHEEADVLKIDDQLTFLDHTLIRAELAIGNGAAAKRLIEKDLPRAGNRILHG